MEILHQEILTELKAIKWILIIIAIAFLYFAFSLLSWLKSIAKGDGALGKRIKHKERSAELEELLNKGDPLAVEYTALEWTASYPQRYMGTLVLS